MARLSRPDFPALLKRLRANHVQAHEAYYRTEVFSGPSLHFHREALASAKSGDVLGFTTQAYAVLAAWGMHRMGRGGSKMRDFAEFRASIEQQWPTIQHLRSVASPSDLDADGWVQLRQVFLGIECMRSGTSLVGNSKVMAHALPALVPPVDREYTLRFIFGRTDIRNDRVREWDTLELLLREFFYPALEDPAICASLEDWVARPDEFTWDTSLLKTMDNLVIGSVKLGRSVPRMPV